MEGSELLRFHPDLYLGTSVRVFPKQEPTQIRMTIFEKFGN